MFHLDNLEHFDTSDHDTSIPYDEQLINKLQFSALLTSFAGWRKDEEIISALIDYFRSNYKETSEERNDKKALVSPRNHSSFQTMYQFFVLVTKTSE